MTANLLTKTHNEGDIKKAPSYHQIESEKKRWRDNEKVKVSENRRGMDNIRITIVRQII